MGKFLKIKCEGGGSVFDYNDAIEFTLNVSDFIGFVGQFSSTSVVLGLSSEYNPPTSYETTSVFLEVADSTGVDTKPSIIVEKTIIETLLSNPGADFLKLVLPKNYVIKSYKLDGFVI
jgi:hypothetical protein